MSLARDIIEQLDWSKRTTYRVVSIPFVEGVPTLEKARKITQWFKDHANDKYNPYYVRMYHGTGKSLPIVDKGLLPTSATRRRSFQSSSGFVYLAVSPERAKAFGDLGNQGNSVVYEVVVKVRDCLPDIDQLNNQRSVGNDVGNSIGESIVYGGGCRVKGRIEPWQIQALIES